MNVDYKKLERSQKLLDEISEALESRGIAHSTNGKAIGEMADRLEKLETALKAIQDPIAHLRKEAEASGARLDGGMAIRLSESANYLKEIARKALE